MDRYQGAEYDVIFLDEATQLKEEWLRQFAACLRGVNEFPKRLYYTCNPGGPGHSYIKAPVHRPAVPGGGKPR